VTTNNVSPGSSNPFAYGAFVLLTLSNPREKYWGAVLRLESTGITVRGIPLDALDDFTSQVRSGDAVGIATLFFPMHRVERLELDQRDGEVPALFEQFEAKTGAVAGDLFSVGARR
jgi:hypothetical protein